MSNIGEIKKARDSVWWVYMVKCVDGSLYTGCTTDPDRRLRQHNGQIRGGARYTRSRQPVRPAGIMRVSNSRSDALKKELSLKKMTRAEKLDWCNKNPWCPVETPH